MNVLKIMQAGQLILELTGLGLEAALKLKAVLELSPNIEANIENLAATSDAANQDTLETVKAWKAANGI